MITYKVKLNDMSCYLSKWGQKFYCQDKVYHRTIDSGLTLSNRVSRIMSHIRNSNFSVATTRLDPLDDHVTNLSHVFVLASAWRKQIFSYNR